MTSSIKENFIFKSNADPIASCRVCNKQFNCSFNGNKRNYTSLYRHYRTMHPTLIERGSKYPFLKRSPCDLNDEGSQAKYRKVHEKPFFDQNVHSFENIGTMKGGGIINEEESL